MHFAVRLALKNEQLRRARRRRARVHCVVLATSSGAESSAQIVAPIEAHPLLHGRRILVVHSEPLIGLELADRMVDEGAEIIGPAYKLDDALKGAVDPRLDAAVLNVIFAGGTTLDIADALRQRGVPVVFYTAMEPTYMAQVAAKLRALVLAAPDEKELIAPVVAQAIANDRGVRGTAAVVSENKELRELIRMILERQALSVRSYGNGLAALAELSRAPCDVGIFAEFTPNTSMVDLHRRLHQTGCTMPVILLSPEAGKIAVRLGGTDLAAAGYVELPFVPEEFAQYVQKMLMLRRTQQVPMLRCIPARHYVARFPRSRFMRW